MVPLLMLNEKRSVTQNLQGTHSTNAKCVIKVYTLGCLVLWNPNHYTCMIQPGATYYSQIPLSAFKICALYAYLSLNFYC